MIKLDLKNKERIQAFAEVEMYLLGINLPIVSTDFQRPWGGFFVIDEAQTKQFADLFFPDIDLTTLLISGKLSPKILVVEPGKRLSWQYHHRRAEIWRVLSGPVEVITSFTDEEMNVNTLTSGQEVQLAQGQRHRLRGLSGWGVLAEIWQHTNVQHPSDENDIVRVHDDFGR